MKLNAGLDYYQGNKIIKKILDLVCKENNLSITDICEKLGNFLWKNNLLYNFRLCNLTPDDLTVPYLKDIKAFYGV